MKIGIIDYGMGNLHSVLNACRYLGISAFVSGIPDALSEADGLILPGVGAFPDAAACLASTGMKAYLEKLCGSKPIIGICLGMQLLFERGYEGRPCEGLGLLSGEVVGIRAAQFGLKVPQMGWNRLMLRQPESHLMRNVGDGAYAYFVHSYMAVPKNSADLIATVDYGEPVCAIVGSDAKRIYGTQFHPEKSGEAGLQILRNFAELI